MFFLRYIYIYDIWNIYDISYYNVLEYKSEGNPFVFQAFSQTQPISISSWHPNGRSWRPRSFLEDEMQGDGEELWVLWRFQEIEGLMGLITMSLCIYRDVNPIDYIVLTIRQKTVRKNWTAKLRDTAKYQPRSPAFVASVQGQANAIWQRLRLQRCRWRRDRLFLVSA